MLQIILDYLNIEIPIESDPIIKFSFGGYSHREAVVLLGQDLFCRRHSQADQILLRESGKAIYKNYWSSKAGRRVSRIGDGGLVKDRTFVPP